MASDFPGSPKIMKGALVAYQPPQQSPTVIVFQYNPEHLTRSVSGRPAGGSGRGDALRTDGPPEETISVAIEIDATDQLETGAGPAAEVGLHPVLAALEGLLYPALSAVQANQALAASGGAAILGEPSPLAFFIWGPSRILPVRITSMSIAEQAFDTRLNPILARVDLGLRVMTYRDMETTNPGYWVYWAAFSQKEAMAARNPGQSGAAIGTALPL